MDLIEQFKEQAKKKPQRIVLPEGDDERIVAAAAEIVKEGIAKPVVIGTIETIKAHAAKLNVKTDGMELIEPLKSPNFEKYVKLYASKRSDVSEAMAAKLVKKAVMFGAVMVAAGDADGMVAGAANATATILQASTLAIGFEKGINTPSSFFMMVVPEFQGEKDKVFFFADCAVNIQPNAAQLADIAVSTGRSAKVLLGTDPKVAMLSFSTKGSASHADVDKVVEAMKLAQEKDPSMAIDGEMQGDSALIQKVAEKKIKGGSTVAGKANVLVFPDLDAGNIAYKLTQYLANAKAYGPILQGFAKPVSDLSRGATAKDIVGIAAIMAVKAQRS